MYIVSSCMVVALTWNPVTFYCCDEEDEEEEEEEKLTPTHSLVRIHATMNLAQIEHIKYARILHDFIAYTHSLEDKDFRTCMRRLYAHIATIQKKVEAIGVRMEKMDLEYIDTKRYWAVCEYFYTLEDEYDKCSCLLEHIGGLWAHISGTDVRAMRQDGLNNKLLRRVKHRQPHIVAWEWTLSAPLSIHSWLCELIEIGATSYALLEFAIAFMGIVPA